MFKGNSSIAAILKVVIVFNDVISHNCITMMVIKQILLGFKPQRYELYF